VLRIPVHLTQTDQNTKTNNTNKQNDLIKQVITYKKQKLNLNQQSPVRSAFSISVHVSSQLFYTAVHHRTVLMIFLLTSGKSPLLRCCLFERKANTTKYRN